jgi:hypothetical protein
VATPFGRRHGLACEQAPGDGTGHPKGWTCAGLVVRLDPELVTDSGGGATADRSS